MVSLRWPSEKKHGTYSRKHALHAYTYDIWWLARCLAPMQGHTETSRAGFSPWLTSPRPHPHPKSPHEFSMRLAAHLCGDRPHRHHRARTKLVNLLTASATRSLSPWGSLLVHGVSTVRALAAQTHRWSTVTQWLEKIPRFLVGFIWSRLDEGLWGYFGVTGSME